jgi:hypothetical protein
VTGFRIPKDPQWFSLIGHHFSDVSVPVTTICKVAEMNCKSLSPIIVCQRWPELCRTRTIVPLKKGPRTPISFRSIKEKLIIPVGKYCGTAISCPRSMELGLGYNLEVVTKGTPLVLEIYTPDGKLKKQDASRNLAKRVSFFGKDGAGAENYLLVLSQLKDIALPSADFEVNIRVY